MRVACWVRVGTFGRVKETVFEVVKNTLSVGVLGTVQEIVRSTVNVL